MIKVKRTLTEQVENRCFCQLTPCFRKVNMAQEWGNKNESGVSSWASAGNYLSRVKCMVRSVLMAPRLWAIFSCVQSLSHVQFFATVPWTGMHQVPLSMEFSRQEHWSGLLFPSPGDLPNPGIEPGSPALQAYSLPTELWGKPQKCILYQFSPFSVWPSHNGSISAPPFKLKTVLTQGFCTQRSLCLELHASTYAHGLHLSFPSSLCSKACISERSSIMDWIEYPT